MKMSTSSESKSRNKTVAISATKYANADNTSGIMRSVIGSNPVIAESLADEKPYSVPMNTKNKLYAVNFRTVSTMLPLIPEIVSSIKPMCFPS